MESLTRRRLLREHRRLLREFRRFDPAAGSDAVPDPAEVRGALAFLRQELHGLMVREERLLRPGSARELVALDHAFLRVKCESLRRLWHEIGRRGRGADRSTLDANHRNSFVHHFAQIEAALTIHLRHLEDPDFPSGFRSSR